MIIRTQFYDRLLAHPELFEYLAGISVSNFKKFVMHHHSKLGRPFTSKVKSEGSGSTFPVESIFLCTFILANKYVTSECFAELLGTSRSDAKRAISRFIPLLIDAKFSDINWGFSPQLSVNIRYISAYACESSRNYYPSGNIPSTKLLASAVPEEYESILKEITAPSLEIARAMLAEEPTPVPSAAPSPRPALVVAPSGGASGSSVIDSILGREHK